jgi:hypothetical protein
MNTSWSTKMSGSSEIVQCSSRPNTSKTTSSAPRPKTLSHQAFVARDGVQALVRRFGEGQEREQATVQVEAEVERGISLDHPEPQPDYLREDEGKEEDPDQGPQERPRET